MLISNYCPAQLSTHIKAELSGIWVHITINKCSLSNGDWLTGSLCSLSLLRVQSSLYFRCVLLPYLKRAEPLWLCSTYFDYPVIPLNLQLICHHFPPNVSLHSSLRWKLEDVASVGPAAVTALCSVWGCRLQGCHHHPHNQMGRHSSAAGGQVPTLHRSTVAATWPHYIWCLHFRSR